LIIKYGLLLQNGLILRNGLLFKNSQELRRYLLMLMLYQILESLS